MLFSPSPNLQKWERRVKDKHALLGMQLSSAVLQIGAHFSPEKRSFYITIIITLLFF